MNVQWEVSGITHLRSSLLLKACRKKIDCQPFLGKNYYLAWFFKKIQPTAGNILKTKNVQIRYFSEGGRPCVVLHTNRLPRGFAVERREELVIRGVLKDPLKKKTVGSG